LSAIVRQSTKKARFGTYQSMDHIRLFYATVCTKTAAMT
jgi:hypothetical protein